MQDKDRFDTHYKTFQGIVQDLEKFLCAYLHVIFMRKMKTQQGLDVITKSVPFTSNYRSLKLNY